MDGKDLSGTSRAISIGWRIENGFELVGKIGPSDLQNYGTISSIDFSLKPKSILDWREASLQLELKNFDGLKIKFSNGDLSGLFTESFQKFTDAKLTLFDIYGEVFSEKFSADVLSLKLTNYDTSQPLVQQNSLLKFGLQKVLIPQVTLSLAKVSGDIGFSGKTILFNLFATEANFGEDLLEASSLNLSSKNLSPLNFFNSSWDFSIFEMRSRHPDIYIKNYSGNLTSTPSGFSHAGNALISSLELKSDQYVLGKIENAVLDVDISGKRSSSRMDVEGRAELIIEQVDDFNASVSFVSPLFGVDVQDCFDLKCEVGDLEINYNIDASGSALTGTSRCQGAACFRGVMKHVLKTDNTDKFFEGLLSLNILSPLSFPMAYFAILGGKALGDGHLLKF